VVVGEERSGGAGLVGGFVAPDGGGEGEYALHDAGADAFGFAAAVAFEVELACADRSKITRRGARQPAP